MDKDDDIMKGTWVTAIKYKISKLESFIKLFASLYGFQELRHTQPDSIRSISRMWPSFISTTLFYLKL